MERRIRVLIVDDQKSVRHGLRALLALCPEVELVGEAADGLEAVHMAADRRPDVVLMDLVMPVMDGLEATRCIKSSQPEVTIVALTVYGEYQQAAKAAGMDRFLAKGCSAENLLTALFTSERSQHLELP